MRNRILLLLLAASSFSAHAGRPMGTDDAGTVGDRQCQFEAWRERSTEARGWTLAPACGLGEFELGLEFGQTKLPENEKESVQAMALKWAPEVLHFGPINLGAKAWTGRSRLKTEDDSGRWQGSEHGLLALASWDAGHGINVHANLGGVRDRIAREYLHATNLAVSWDANERIQIFAEMMKQQHSPTTQATGLRVWALPGQVAVDITYARSAGVKDSDTYGIGFGWYGIFGN